MLGCTDDPVWLDLPDGHLGAAEAALRSGLAAAITGADLMIAPWPGDGHPDHEVVGRVAADVAAEMGVRAVAYPVWAWCWGAPEDLEAHVCSVLALPARAVRAKQAAMACYPSQTTSMLGEVIVDEAMVERFSRPFEVYVGA